MALFQAVFFVVIEVAESVVYISWEMRVGLVGLTRRIQLVHAFDRELANLACLILHEGVAVASKRQFGEDRQP